MDKDKEQKTPQADRGHHVPPYGIPVKRYCQTLDLKEIYSSRNHLFMIVETPLDFDWDTAMKQLSTLPRQAEWEAYMACFQDCRPEADAAEKWKLMERMFHLY